MNEYLMSSPLTTRANSGIGVTSPLAGPVEQSALGTLLSYMQPNSVLGDGSPTGPGPGAPTGAPSTGSLAGDLAGIGRSGMAQAALGIAMNPMSLATTVPATMMAAALNALSDTPAKGLNQALGIRGLANAVTSAFGPGAFGARHGEITDLDRATQEANAAAKGMSLSDLADSKTGFGESYGGFGEDAPSPGGQAGHGAAADSATSNSTAAGQDAAGPGSDNFRRGGLVALAGGGKIAMGPGGGLDDLIPTTIDGRSAAALSDGEFVIPADVVSMMGDGSSNEGSRRLYDFVKMIRQSKTGTAEQAGPLPVGDILRRTLS